MSSILLSWLNETLQLSTPVTSFEADFSTGYLIGEILARHNQQADFSDFRPEDKSDSKINNFTRLEPTLRRLGVPFDTKVAQQVMMKQKGAAAKLVYQVKAALEKIRAPVVGRSEEATVRLAAVRERASKPTFEARSKEMFEKSIRKVAENQNDLYLAKHMSKFGVGFDKLVEERDAAAQAKVEAAEKKLQEKRQAALQRLRKNHAAAMTANERGIEDWQRNQEIRLRQLQGEATFAQRTAVRAGDAAMMRTATVATSVLSGIDEFEAIAASHGLSTAPGEPSAPVVDEFGTPVKESRDDFFDRLSRAVGVEADMREAAEGQMEDIRRKRDARLRASGIRDRRRIAFVQGLELGQEASLGRSRDDVIVSALVKRSGPQLEVDDKVATVRAQEAVFLDNRVAADAEAAAVAAKAHADLLAHQNAVYARDVANYEAAVATAMKEYGKQRSSREARAHANNTATCGEVLASIVDIAIVAAQQREIRRSDAPVQEVRDIGVVFVAGLPIASAVVVPPRVVPESKSGEEGELLVTANGGVVGEALDASVAVSEASPAGPTPVNALLDAVAFDDLQSASGPWADIRRDSESPDELVEGKAAEEEAAEELSEELKAHKAGRPSVPHLYPTSSLPFVLGEVVRELEAAADPAPVPTPHPALPSFPIRMALIGAPFSGKKTQAARLAAAHKLTLIDADALGYDANAINAAIRAVTSGEGWLLLNYPRNITEARALEVELTGFKESLPSPTPQTARWDAAMAPRQQLPTDPGAVSWPSGIDVVVRLDLPTDRLVRRVLGRRLHSTLSGVVYHVDDTPPPHNLTTKDQLTVPPVSDPIAVGSALEVYTQESPELDVWFSRGQHLAVLAAWRPNGDAWAAPRWDTLNQDDFFAALSVTVKEKAAAVHAAREHRARLTSEHTARVKSTGDDVHRLVSAAVNNAKGSDHLPPPLLPVQPPGAGDGDSKLTEEEAAPAALAKESLGDPSQLPVVVVPKALPSPLSSLLLSFWRSAVKRFGSQTEAGLRGLRFERAAGLYRLAVTRRRLENFLRRPNTPAQEILVKFQEAFNSVDDDSRFDDAVKSELHLRLSTAVNSLWDVVDSRENVSRKQITALQGDGWVSDTQQALAARYARLIQLEVDRFQSSQQLLLDYFSGVGTGVLSESAPWSLSLAVAPVEPEPVATGKKGAPPAKAAPAKAAPAGKGGKAPDVVAEPADGKGPLTLEAATALSTAALTKGKAACTAALTLVGEIRRRQAAERDKLWQSHFTAIAAEREAREAAAEAAAGGKGKGKAPAKPAPKAAAGKKGGAEPAEEKPSGPYPFVPEALLDVITYEAKRLRSRVSFLNRKCVEECTIVSTTADTVFSALTEAVGVAALGEGAAVEAMRTHVTAAIEAATPLKNPLSIQGRYFSVDGSSALIEEPPAEQPKILEATRAFHLSPSQLSTLAHALRSASLSSPGSVPGEHFRLIPIPAFVEVLHRLALAGKLAPKWSSIPQQALYALAGRFVPSSPGLVDWQSFCVSLAVGGVAGVDMPSSVSGSAQGTSLHAHLTHAQAEEMRRTFEKLDPTGSGTVKAEDVDSVDVFPVVQPSRSATLAALQEGKEEHPAPVALTAESWHNVCPGFSCVNEWKSAEEAAMAHTARVLANDAQLEREEGIHLQSTVSVSAAAANLKRALFRAFADSATSLLAYRRVAAYFDPEAPTAAPRDVYEQLVASAVVDETPALDG